MLNQIYCQTNNANLHRRLNRFRKKETISTLNQTTNQDKQKHIPLYPFSTFRWKQRNEKYTTITSNKRIQTGYKIPLKTALDSDNNLNTPVLTREQGNTVIRVCRELHKYSFKHVDNLLNINMDNKRKIISKTMMCIQHRDYDPSNENVSNYSDTKTI